MSLQIYDFSNSKETLACSYYCIGRKDSLNNYFNLGVIDFTGCGKLTQNGCPHFKKYEELLRFNVFQEYPNKHLLA
jgi:hypothetical protein